METDGMGWSGDVMIRVSIVCKTNLQVEIYVSSSSQTSFFVHKVFVCLLMHG